MSQGLSPARVQNQPSLTAVVNLEGKEKAGESSEAKNKPAQSFLKEVANASKF